jgi:glycosyltransferase involved in cell wall biosynthesis
MRASVIVTSYNYGLFLRTAIDSVLAQTYPAEVIVVDDGSTDESRQIIESYGKRIVSLFKANGGQGSALNTAVRASSGDVIVFLDSDDGLYPQAIERAVDALRMPGASKVHWNLNVGVADGTVHPQVVRPELSEGDLLDAVLRGGADAYTWPPTSGNAWTRAFIEKAFPIPEREFTTCPDFFLATLAPLYGAVRRIAEPLGFWRYHSVNASFNYHFEDNLRAGLARAERCFDALGAHARRLGLRVDSGELRRASRWHLMENALRQIEEIVPRERSFILVDQNHWATPEVLRGRQRFLFLERHGMFSGQPADDSTAIRELERLRQAGAAFIVFVWPYLWWLEHYKGFLAYLRSRYRIAAQGDRLVAFELRPATQRPRTVP